MRHGGTRTALKLTALVALTIAAVLWPRPGPADASGAVAVAAGGVNTCVLSADGGVKCWGENTVGQVGDGTVSPGRLTPVDVVGLESEVTAVTTTSRSCALTTDGALKCWGDNGYGQLGDGTTTNRSTPVDVCQDYDDDAQKCRDQLTDVASIAVGSSLHTCALTSSGGVKCWGRNEWGQLGDGTLGDGDPVTLDNIRTTPVDVCQDYDEVAGECTELLSGVAAVATGGNYTCAVMADSTARCWGSNVAGQLGDGAGGGNLLDPSVHPTPVDVCQEYDEAAQRCTELLTGVVAIAPASLHTCALATAGGIKCWGGSFRGRLGDGLVCGAELPFHCLTPVDVVGLESGATAVTTGGSYTCALTTAGGVKCWEDNLSPGQIGDGGRCGLVCPTPVDVCADAACTGALSEVAGIAAGSRHTCALTTAGGVKCWGWNNFGQLGDGTRTDRNTPVNVVGLEPKPTPMPTATQTPAAPAGSPTAIVATPSPPAVSPTELISVVLPVILPQTGTAGPSGGGAPPWVAAVAAGAVALGAAAWYARRCFSRG